MSPTRASMVCAVTIGTPVKSGITNPSGDIFSGRRHQQVDAWLRDPLRVCRRILRQHSAFGASAYGKCAVAPTASPTRRRLERGHALIGAHGVGHVHFLRAQALGHAHAPFAPHHGARRRAIA